MGAGGRGGGGVIASGVHCAATGFPLAKTCGGWGGGVEGAWRWRGGGGGGGLSVPYRTEPSARNTAQYIPPVPILNSHDN